MTAGHLASGVKKLIKAKKAKKNLLNQAMDDHDAKTEKHEPKAAEPPVLGFSRSGINQPPRGPVGNYSSK